MTSPPRRLAERMEEQVQGSIQQQQQLQQQLQQLQDTRTHVVGELYDTERSYVESLQILVEKYMKPLKSYEGNRNLIDSSLVDEIFYTIPEILQHHENFLSALQDRLSSDWDSSQVIGNVFIEAFTNQQVIDTYTAFINNWKNARHAIKLATQAKPAFERFLEAMSREHRNKLTLDALLIMPVQRIPRYELLIKELMKHTPEGHPDHGPLTEAQREIHELALKIDRADREWLQQEQLRDIEALIEGHIELQHPQRDFIRYDLVTVSASSTLAAAAAAKKERVLFLFCDLLIMASVKKKASRRSNLLAAFSNSCDDLGLLEGNKFKLRLRLPLDQVEVKQEGEAGSQHQRQTLAALASRRRQIESDLSILQQIESLSGQLNALDQAELVGAVARLAGQLEKNLLSLDSQQQPLEVASQQELFVVQQADDASALNNSTQFLDQERSIPNGQASAEQSVALEFAVINSPVQQAAKETGANLNANLSSSSMTSDVSAAEHGNQLSSGDLAQLAAGSTSSGPVSNHETLVVAFTSPERRKAFLQAFMEAKQSRAQQQQLRSQQHSGGARHYGSGSLTLRLSSQEQSPSRMCSTFDGAGDLRRTRLQHQDEVDLRHLENLSAAMRTNCTIEGGLARARNSSAPHHGAPNAQTIVHQMSAPHALASVGAAEPNERGCPLSGASTSAAGRLECQCDTCSPSCPLDSHGLAELQADRRGHLHHHHHHHQLMHQPASQPAMLNMICCHEHHNDSLAPQPADAGGHLGCSFQRRPEEVWSGQCRLALEPEHRAGSSAQAPPFALELELAPKFMCAVPTNFLAFQHPTLQFTCAAGRKQRIAGGARRQTVQDDRGQFWLCMSNGYVSHVALVALERRKKLGGSRAGNHLQDASPSRFEIIPAVRSGGDICKSQINCAAQVCSSSGPRRRRDSTSGEPPAGRRRSETGRGAGVASGPPVKVAVKSASPPVAVAAQCERRHCGGLSESAPSAGAIHEELERASFAKVNLSSPQSSSQLSAPASPCRQRPWVRACRSSAQGAMSRRSHQHSHEGGARTRAHHAHGRPHCHHQRSLSPSCSLGPTWQQQQQRAGQRHARCSGHHHHLQQGQQHGAYAARHHTVPLAELRRALERQNRIAASDSEGITCGSAARRALQSRLAPPPSNTPCALDRNSLDSSDGSERRLSPVGSLESRGSRAGNPLAAKKARSTTPPARYSALGDTHKPEGLRPARMLRHQVSLKTSSILAKLVSGATRGSSYLKRKDSALARGCRKAASARAGRKSDQEDNDTDTDSSRQMAKQDDASSVDSASAAPAAGSLAVPRSRAAPPRESSLSLRATLGLNLSNPNVSASVVSPLSSVSSLASTNSSLTVNSAWGSSHALASCALLNCSSQSQPSQSHWSSATCCAADSAGGARLSGRRAAAPRDQCDGAMRARSATVPCRALLYQRHQPDAYLITRCPLAVDQSAPNELASLDSGYKVSEILAHGSPTRRQADSDLRRTREGRSPSTKDSTEIMDHDHDDGEADGDREDGHRASLWLGCNDGSLIVLDCLDPRPADEQTGEPGSDANLDSSASSKWPACGETHRELKLGAPVCDIKVHQDQNVFVALSNGQLAVFSRLGADCAHEWDLERPKIITVCRQSEAASSCLCLVGGGAQQVWYSHGRTIYVLGLASLKLEGTILAPNGDKSIQFPMQTLNIDHLELAECLNGVWVSFRGNSLIQFYDRGSLKLLLEMSLLEPISKVLSYGNEIIRQHKTACLGATSLLSVSTRRCHHRASGRPDGADGSACVTSLFVGTTAGIVIYLNITQDQLKSHVEAEKSVWNPQVVSLRHGHSGQVRFLRLVEMPPADSDLAGELDESEEENESGNGNGNEDETGGRFCLVSAGAGVDLYGPNNDQQIVQQLQGEEDCLNHLILWQL